MEVNRLTGSNTFIQSEIVLAYHVFGMLVPLDCRSTRACACPGRSDASRRASAFQCRCTRCLLAHARVCGARKWRVGGRWGAGRCCGAGGVGRRWTLGWAPRQSCSALSLFCTQPFPIRTRACARTGRVHGGSALVGRCNSRFTKIQIQGFFNF